MTEDEVRELIARITSDPDPEREYELRHADCLIDIPQSGERFDRDGMRELQRHFPGGPPDMNLVRLQARAASGSQSWSRTTARSAEGSSTSA